MVQISATVPIELRIKGENERPPHSVKLGRK